MTLEMAKLPHILVVLILVIAPLTQGKAISPSKCPVTHITTKYSLHAADECTLKILRALVNQNVKYSS